MINFLPVVLLFFIVFRAFSYLGWKKPIYLFWIDFIWLHALLMFISFIAFTISCSKLLDAKMLFNIDKLSKPLGCSLIYLAMFIFMIVWTQDQKKRNKDRKRNKEIIKELESTLKRNGDYSHFTAFKKAVINGYNIYQNPKEMLHTRKAFNIDLPRGFGKTSYFKILNEHLRKDGKHIILISMLNINNEASFIEEQERQLRINNLLPLKYIIFKFFKLHSIFKKTNFTDLVLGDSSTILVFEDLDRDICKKDDDSSIKIKLKLINHLIERAKEESIFVIISNSWTQMVFREKIQRFNELITKDLFEGKTDDMEEVTKVYKNYASEVLPSPISDTHIEMMLNEYADKSISFDTKELYFNSSDLEDNKFKKEKEIIWKREMLQLYNNNKREYAPYKDLNKLDQIVQGISYLRKHQIRSSEKIQMNKDQSSLFLLKTYVNKDKWDKLKINDYFGKEEKKEENFYWNIVFKPLLEQEVFGKREMKIENHFNFIIDLMNLVFEKNNANELELKKVFKNNKKYIIKFFEDNYQRYSPWFKKSIINIIESIDENKIDATYVSQHIRLVLGNESIILSKSKGTSNESPVVIINSLILVTLINYIYSETVHKTRSSASVNIYLYNMFFLQGIKNIFLKSSPAKKDIYSFLKNNMIFRFHSYNYHKEPTLAMIPRSYGSETFLYRMLYSLKKKSKKNNKKNKLATKDDSSLYLKNMEELQKNAKNMNINEILKIAECLLKDPMLEYLMENQPPRIINSLLDFHYNHHLLKLSNTAYLTNNFYDAESFITGFRKFYPKTNFTDENLRDFFFIFDGNMGNLIHQAKIN